MKKEKITTIQKFSSEEKLKEFYDVL
jgi:hypothetical protein